MAREPAEQSNPSGSRAADSRDRAGVSSRGPTEPPAEGVLTMVCVKCGTEYHFADAPPPEGMSCEKCGSEVFRDFFTPEANAEAAEDFDHSTARDLDPDDAEGDTLPGDVMDLNRD